MGSGEQVRGIGDAVDAVEIVLDHGQVVVILRGDIDVELTEQLDAAALAVQRHRLPVRVDATRVTFMDSTGAWFIARCSGYGEVKVAASSQVQFLMHVLALDHLVDDHRGRRS